MSDQRSRAEEDHEDDEGLEPAVLYYLVTRLPRSPPDLTKTCCRVEFTAPKPGHAHCGRETWTEKRKTERELTRQFTPMSLVTIF